MAKNSTNIDDEEIASLSGITINEAQGDFSAEWESYTFMDNIKKSVTSLIDAWGKAIANEKSYLNGTEVISNTPSPDLHEVSPEKRETNLGSGVVTADSLRVRAHKGYDQRTIAFLSKSDTVEIIKPDKGSGWTKVKLSDGTKGYVKTEWLADFSD